MRRQFNTRLFLILMGAMVFMTVSVAVVHWLQTGRIAAALLFQAKRAEEQGQLDLTARYLSRYLEFQPTDAAERAHLGQVLASGVLDAKKTPSARARQRALFVVQQVVAQDPSRDDLKLQLAKLAMLEDQPDLALTHLKELPESPETLDLIGACHESANRRDEAAAAYWKAIQLDKHRLDTYSRLAILMKRPSSGELKLPVKAPEELLNILVEKNADNFKAHIIRWQHRPKTLYKDPGFIKKAAEDVSAAMKLAPEEGDSLLAAGELAILEAMAVAERIRGGEKTAVPERDAHLAKGREYLHKGLKLHLHDRRFYLTLAQLELTGNNAEAALTVLDQGLKTLPNQFELQWMQANVLLDNSKDPGNLDRAKAVLAEMNKSRSGAMGADYLQARLAMLSGQWREAAQKLESVRITMDKELASAGLLNQVDNYLARCYEQIDEVGLRMQALDRVVKRTEQFDATSPALITTRRDLVNTLLAQGRFDDAVLEIDRSIKASGGSKAQYVELARVLMARNLARGLSTWDEVQKALDQAPADSMDAHMLQVRLLAIRGDLPKAEEHLEKVLKAFPKKIEPWTAKASLADLRKEPAKAVEILQEAEKILGDSVELRLARARHWAQLPRDTAEPELKKLFENSDKFTDEEDRTKLYRGLVEANYQVGLVSEALHIWGQMAALPMYKNDMRVQQVHYDLALENKAWPTVEMVLADIQRIEGPGGPLGNYGHALKLIRQAEDQGKPPPAKARELLDQVATARPKWSVVHMARAELELKTRNYEQAVLRLREALAAGESRNPRVVYRLAGLLRQLGRNEEANREIRNLPAQAIDPNMLWLAVDLALQNHDPAEAVRRAMNAVPRGSNNYLDYLRLGAVFAADGRKEEAEKNLRLAVKLGDKEPDTWGALCQFLVSQKRKAEAEKVVEQAEQALPAEVKARALGRCYEMLGETDLAQKYFQETLQRQPDHVPTLRALVNFHIRGGRLTEAEPLLRSVLEGKLKASDEDKAWARRGLAMVQAAGGDFRHIGEALAGVSLSLDPRDGVIREINVPDGGFAVEERRAQAQVLATQPQKAFRTKAIECLHEVERRGALTLEDRHLLARLFEAEGAATKARDQWQELVKAQNSNPVCLQGYAAHLLKARQFNEAGLVIKRLEDLEKSKKVEVGAFGSVELSARLLEGRGEGDKALELLRGFVARPTARPEETFVLVSCLARLQKTEEALALCDKTWGKCPPAMVSGASIAVLRAADKPNAGQLSGVEKRVEEAAQQNPDKLIFLLHLADLYDLKGDYDKAQAMYRRVLDKDAKNFMALNNLAWLIAQTSGDRQEALQLISKAIDALGERPELLDTRATVFLAQKQAKQAIADLERANADARTEARSFRLAQAYLQANDKANAAKVLREAQQAGLKPNQLHPIEQKAFRQLVEELQPQ